MQSEKKYSSLVGMEAIEGSPPFLLPVLGGQKEARKRNLSIASISVCLQYVQCA